MKFQHQALASGRWQELSLAEQLGNVGSEIGRAIRWRDKDQQLCESALGRCRELLDLTIADPRWRGRLKELTRFRELLNDAILGGATYGTRLEDLDRYCFTFAFAARKRHAEALSGGFSSLGILAVVATVLVLAGGGYFAYQRFAKPTDTGGMACTQEAKLCPDGSSVGRTGPNCEFAACPGEVNTSTWKTYRNEQHGFEVRYPNDFEVLSNEYPGNPYPSITFRDKIYHEGGPVFPSLVIDTSGVGYQDAKPSKIFEAANAKPVDGFSVIQIYFDARGVRVFASCWFRRDDQEGSFETVTMCNGILATLRSAPQ